MTACGREMRNGTCALDEGHRGRCSTVAFFCDDCQQMRRSQPAWQEYNRFDDTIEVQVCWFCIRVKEHGKLVPVA